MCEKAIVTDSVGNRVSTYLLDLSRLLDVEVQALTGHRGSLRRTAGLVPMGLETFAQWSLATRTSSRTTSPPPTATSLRTVASDLHQEYQAAKYGSVIRELPMLIGQADSA